MTLIAGLFINGHPLLIGDVLITGNEVLGRPLFTPTVGDITTVFSEGAGYVPVTLRQKVVIVGDNLVVGWAGDYIAAKTIIRELQEKNSQEPFTIDSLLRHFDTVKKSKWNTEVQIIGFIHEEPTTVEFCFNGVEFTNPTFGRMAAAGSGAQHFRDVIEHTDYGSVILGVDSNASQISTAHGLTFSGILLSAEIATSDSLRNYFGAGYEIASLIDGKFQKVDDVTSLFWFGKLTDSGMEIGLHQICKYKYIDDFLLIRTATISKDSVVKGQLLADPAIVVVPPIFKNLTKQDVDSFHLPLFDSNQLCYYVRVVNKDGKIGTACRIEYSLEGDFPVLFTDTDTGLDMKFHEERLNKLFSEVEAHLIRTSP